MIFQNYDYSSAWARNSSFGFSRQDLRLGKNQMGYLSSGFQSFYFVDFRLLSLQVIAAMARGRSLLKFMLITCLFNFTTSFH